MIDREGQLWMSDTGGILLVLQSSPVEPRGPAREMRHLCLEGENVMIIRCESVVNPWEEWRLLTRLA
jgi:hypothetical protein